MMEAKDTDPQNPCLKYICDRFELNIEQRYWLAFLFGTCYCAPTVYYIYNEFPDFETASVSRMEKWWKENKSKLLFQTDRLRIKTANKFVETFQSYRNLISLDQHSTFSRLKTYQEFNDFALSIKNFGRFSSFIYLELLSVLTNTNIYPDKLDVKNASTVRKGLCDVFNIEFNETISDAQAIGLEGKFKQLLSAVRNYVPTNVWNLETTLCAYKKKIEGKRYVGYYIERNRIELLKLSGISGVNWKPLWDFRRETFSRKYLNEFNTPDRSSL